MLLEQLKQSFFEMVAAERGDKLRVSREDLLEAGIYTGTEAVRLGLVDEIGGANAAISKAADLARISHYKLVDVNVEVFRIFNQKFRRIVEPLDTGAESQLNVADIRGLMGSSTATDDPAGPPGGLTAVDMLRRVYLPSHREQLQRDAPPGFPLETNPPMIYHLYVGPTE